VVTTQQGGFPTKHVGLEETGAEWKGKGERLKIFEWENYPRTAWLGKNQAACSGATGGFLAGRAGVGKQTRNNNKSSRERGEQKTAKVNHPCTNHFKKRSIHSKKGGE